MTGVTSGQTALPTATDSDDTEIYLTTGLVAALQALANLFESATGHDHNGAGKGAQVTRGTAMTVTSGLTVSSGTITVTAGGVTIGDSQSVQLGTTNPAASGDIRFRNNRTIGWRNAANSADDSIAIDGSDRFAFGGISSASSASTGSNGAPPAQVADYWIVSINGGVRKIPCYLT